MTAFACWPRTARTTTAGVVLAAFALTSCSGHSTAGRDRLLVQSVPATIIVDARHVTGLGTVLTDSSGYTLYMFPPDVGSRVSCTGPCAGTWPALATRSTHPAAGAGVNAAVLATVPDPDTETRVVTYAGYPLYRYAGATTPGTAHGQGLFLDGGPWYAITPAGDPITTTPGQTR